MYGYVFIRILDFGYIGFGSILNIFGTVLTPLRAFKFCFSLAFLLCTLSEFTSYTTYC